MARVGGASRWSPFAVAALTAIVMGMVGIAVGSRLASPPPAVAPAAVPGTFAAPTPEPTPKPVPTVAYLRVPIAPVRTSDPSSTAIRLQVQRQPNEMFVHGDVYVPKVTWVFVSLRDASGTVTGWASVSVPGAAGPGLRGGPTMRFDVELVVPTAIAGQLTIQATAYDRTGHAIGATQLVASADPGP
ncbi:MAG TPA: hypothetical protein VE011_07580 [Candidatus Dormibacteraeota bacterium]|nr:hypothetical protein [Candidatus Dormibacteraeota bacterium]